MSKSRLEAFSDGVIAILITIMVLELKTPQGTDWPSLRPLLPVFSAYSLSFVMVGIYWNNHHHMLHAAAKINGAVLWANLHLLFWLSLVPFGTAWLGASGAAPVPTLCYGIVLFMAAIAYTVLQTVLIHAHPANKTLRQAIGKDAKGKTSLALYLLAIAAACLRPGVTIALFVAVALVWLVPDRRIEGRNRAE